MMRLCLEGATSKADAVREYVSFVNGRSFAWPTSDWNKTAVVQPRLPLRALLDLAVKWGLPLWFRVDLACSHREDRIGIVISPSPFPAAFHYLHSRFLRYADIYPFYVQAFLDVVFSHRPAAPVLETFVRDSSRMQGHVFAKMTSGCGCSILRTENCRRRKAAVTCEKCECRRLDSSILIRRSGVTEP
ncbi:hypothetical protein MRX96_056231 [Rhipicephalus microplus]